MNKKGFSYIVYFQEKNKKICISIVFVVFFLALVSNGRPHRLFVEKQFVDNRVVVKLSEEAELFEQIFNKISIKILKNIRLEEVLFNRYNSEIKGVRMDQYSDYYTIETHENCDIEVLCEKLREETYVKDASPDYFASLASNLPNDTYFQYQYALSNTGQVYLPEAGLSGTAGSDIKAINGWEWSTGSEDVIIAVIDSGVAVDHEDLQNKIVPGYNFVDGSNNPYDDHGHGTFAASIAAAETNNGVGIAGVSWDSRIMPIKVMDSRGYGSYLTIAAGIRFAVDQGAQVINLSIGGRNPSFILEDACEYAFNSGVVIVAASGNTGSSVLYPAAYDDYCLAVAASDSNDERPAWSNYGPQVDIAAPGVFVWGASYSPHEPDNLNSYNWANGTSFATPYVAGTAALLIAYKPFLSNSQVMALIKYTADDVNSAIHPGVDDFMGYGRINLRTLLGPYEL